MKKNRVVMDFSDRKVTCWSLKKKLTLLLLVMITGVTSMQNLYAQQTRFNLKLNKVAIRQVFQEIEKRSDYVFIYNDKVVDLNRKVSINVQNGDVGNVLDQVFKGTNNTYKINKRQITVLLKSKGQIENEQRATSGQVPRKTITGSIKDDLGEPLPGVNVVIKGTTIGTITDMDGKYTMSNMYNDAILQFSFIGLATQEVVVGDQMTIDIQLKPDFVGLDEVVAIGYGNMKKKDLTGSVVAIKSDDIVSGNPIDVVSGLQGKMSGVRISSSSGDPNAGIDISIRGKNSISAGTNPLFIIDGMPYDVNEDEIASSSVGDNNSSNPLSLIDPSDIETVTVLKDASATSIYGSRGANGVIIVETKSGLKGKTVIKVGASMGFSKSSREIPVLSGNEFIEYRRDIDPQGFLFYHNGDLNSPRNPYSLEQHDWQDEILRTGVQQNYNLSMSGKSGETSYLVSFGVLDNEAIIENNNNQRYTGRLKIENNKNDNLLIGANIAGTYMEVNGATQSGGGSDLFNGIVQNLVISTPVELYNPTFDPGDTYISPSSMIDDAYRKSSTMNLNSNAYLHYAINNQFKLIISGGGMLSSSKGTEFYGKETSWGVGDNGYSNINESRAYSINGTAQLHYSKNLNGNHNFNALVATESNLYNYEWFGVTQTNFLTESTGAFDIAKGSLTKNVGSYRDKNKRISFFGRVNYSYKERHIVTANFRADGSDKFGPGNRFGYFPSVAYSWRLINEGFMEEQSIFSNFKLRASYGLSGNDRIPSYRYLARTENTYYNGDLGMAPNSQANDDLRWETTYQANVGLDLGFIKNRLLLVVDFYDKRTQDMLIPIPTPGKTGYSEQWQNIGKVTNKGFELQVSSKNIDKSNFKWSTEINISHNKNRVEDLGLSDFIPVGIPGGWIQDIGRVSVGRSIGEAYGYEFDGIYQMSDFTWQNNSDPEIKHENREYQLKENVVSVTGVNVKPGSFKFKDLDGDGYVTLEEDRKKISSSDPILFGGITNNFQYKNFDLNILVEGSYGNEIFNESKYRLEGGAALSYMNLTKEFYYNHWTPDNPTNEYGTYADQNATSLLTSSYYVEDASYLRLRNITLGYNLKKHTLKSLGLNSARIYVSCNNFLTLTKYTGYDPEVNSGNPLMSGVDRISYPRSKSVIFGVNISF